MTNAEKAKAIVYHINRLYHQALEERVRSYAEWQASISGYEAIEAKKDDDFDWRNPYNPERAKQKYEKDLSIELTWKEISEYTTNIFLSNIPEDNTERYKNG